MTEIHKQVEGLSQTDNARVLAKLLTKLSRESTPQSSVEGYLQLITADLNKLTPLEPMNALNFEGIRGAGKTTVIDVLADSGKGLSGSRIDTPIYVEVIKPQRKNVNMTMLGGEDSPMGNFYDVLIVAAHHFDRLTKLQQIVSTSRLPLLVDRHWLSFYGLEYAKLTKSGVTPEAAHLVSSMIARNLNPVRKNFIFNSIDVDQGEERVIARGDKGRTQQELDYDWQFEAVINRVINGDLAIENHTQNIISIDAKQRPTEIVNQVLINL